MQPVPTLRSKSCEDRLHPGLTRVSVAYPSGAMTAVLRMMCLKRERARKDTRTWDLAGSPLGPSFTQTRTGSLQSSIQHWNSFFSVAYLSPGRSTRRRLRDLSDPFVRSPHVPSSLA